MSDLIKEYRAKQMALKELEVQFSKLEEDICSQMDDIWNKMSKEEQVMLNDMDTNV